MRASDLVPVCFFFLSIRPPPRSTLLPSPTLSRPLEADPVVGDLDNERPRRVGRLDQADVHATGLSMLDGVVQSLLKDRKSTRLNSSHANISYAVFCLKKKTTR